MLTRRESFICAVLPFLSILIPANARPAARRDNEQELISRIQSEQNPVKKAKYEVRLGRLKLIHAKAAYDKGDIETGQKLLEEYVAEMKAAWAILNNSNRQAVKQPQGFKELDIALREDSRTLDDLAHRVSYEDRDLITKAARGIEEIRNEVLKALFPTEKPKERG